MRLHVLPSVGFRNECGSKYRRDFKGIRKIELEYSIASGNLFPRKFHDLVSFHINDNDINK